MNDIDKFIQTVADLQRVTQNQIDSITVKRNLYHQLEYELRKIEYKPENFKGFSTVRNPLNKVASPLITCFGIKIIKGEN